MAKTSQTAQATDRIATLCAKMVGLADDVLTTEPWTREGQDARRLFRIAIRQMEMRADAPGHPLLIAAVYDGLEKFKEACPDLFRD